MPRIQIPITNVKETAVNYPAEVVGDAANDHYLSFNDGRVWLEVRNTDVSERQVTVRTSAVFGALQVKDIGIPVPAGETIVAGPFNPRLYNQRAGADAGRMLVDVSGAFLRFRAFHLKQDLRGFRGGEASTTGRVRIPITPIYVEEHFDSQLVPAYTTAAPASDHELGFNDGRVILEINNLDGSNPHTAVLNAFGLYPIGQRHGGAIGSTPPGGAMEIEDNAIVVPAGGHVIAGGFDLRVYNPERTLQLIPGGGGTRESVSRLDINVTTDQLQFRAFHLPRVQF